MKIPQIIKADNTSYPPKDFEFTGQWEKMTTSMNGNSAVRNRKQMYFPIYKSADGEIILVCQFASISIEDVELE